MEQQREGPDAVPGDGRAESQNQRMDRNWNEILQELRVTQTGTQILTGFLLTIVFQPKFAELDHYQRVIYLTLVGTAGLTTALGLAPVLLHRELFRRQMKSTVVRSADIFLRCTLGGIGVVLTGTQLLVFDVAVSHRAGLVAASVTLLVVLIIAVLPMVIRLRSRGQLQRQGVSTEPVRAGGEKGSPDESRA
ncbi:MAG: DUF6328 family protein [Propionibacteriaceae bacterium]